jgi:hypothetical protein
MVDVMISLHVATMKESALTLKEMLESTKGSFHSCTIRL